MGAAFRTLDTVLRMFTAFAYVAYRFFTCRAAFAYVGYGFCARCADFAYIYGFSLHIVGIVRIILSRWSNITVYYAALVNI